MIEQVVVTLRQAIRVNVHRGRTPADAMWRFKVSCIISHPDVQRENVLATTAVVR